VRLIVGVQRERTTDLYAVDPATGESEPVAKHDAEASLQAYVAGTSVAAFHAATREGTFLWLSRRGRGPSRVVAANAFLADISEGQTRKIEYRGLDGQDLKAWLILPVGYREGTRSPLVTWVYAGSVVGDKPTVLANLNEAISLNLQLLAAHGYAVLIPSMPLGPEGVTGDPYMELSKGVLPAVDKVVELGIADPKRLGVMGQSYGGFSTYGLVTQTTRFQAAIALAGLADLASLYGQFDARERYDAFPQENLFYMFLAESGQERLGNPPWKDFGRYLRNSPIFYVDRVETPLMIIQGDMDYVAMQQGEQFFMSLYRQNKRAEFVRYWGEGHVLEGPANIRDMWRRIYGWFDEFLAVKPGIPGAHGGD
jgi:dipeptidyl aminopeptidase/acylaminoacyl peptidase